jgi:hypothetical protein
MEEMLSYNGNSRYFAMIRGVLKRRWPMLCFQKCRPLKSCHCRAGDDCFRPPMAMTGSADDVLKIFTALDDERDGGYATTTKSVSFIVIIVSSSDSSVGLVQVIREPAVSAAPFGRSQRSRILVVAKIKVETLGVRLDTATSKTSPTHRPDQRKGYATTCRGRQCCFATISKHIGLFLQAMMLAG